MDINFFDQPDMTPQPRDQMKVLKLSADPYPDRRRVRVEVELTAFTPADKPSLTISAHNTDEQPVADMTIIDAMQRTMSLTLHIREPEPSGQYTVQASLFYEGDGVQDTRDTTFELPE
jgi:hypothetical protein